MTWTPERRAKQAQAIKRWQPWAKSTGARTPEGKAAVSRNAFKGGHRPHLRQLAREVAEEITLTQRLVSDLYANMILHNHIRMQS
jgi:hypothetical protein